MIQHFPDLNNYGTGMMGLVTIQALTDLYGSGNVELHCDFSDGVDLNEIKSELRGKVLLKHYVNKTQKPIWVAKCSAFRKIQTLFYLIFHFEGKGFDYLIVLGGDDLSEYYSKHSAAFEIFNKWKSSFFTKVVLLGLTIGPFNNSLNRFASKFFLNRLNIYARDPWTVEYMKKEFGVKIILMADLALADLPLQSDKTIELEILKRYNLTKDNYVTIVVSGLQSNNFYCNNTQIYLQRFKEIIEILCSEQYLNDKKVCLLAHTFSPYADEAALIDKLSKLIPQNYHNKLVIIKDRILETRARFILGNGLFTITGRMHAAISTFQMGKPAICLSYSVKYKGVIGDSIGRHDLIIEANDSRIWNEGTIVSLVEDKIGYLLEKYTYICRQIKENVSIKKQVINECLKKI